MAGTVSLVLVRLLSGFLALQVADTPLFCFDEQPGESSATAAAPHAAQAPGDLHAAGGGLEEGSASCFCPCHLTFDSERSVAFASVNLLTSSYARLLPADPAAPPQSLDHPPQNLA